MRTVVLTAVILSVSGCHLPCGGCADWESCDSASMQCTVNAGAQFDLVAVDGNVSNSDRTILDGIPNPEICVDISGDPEQCSTAQTLTYSPSWNQTLATGLDGMALLTTPIPMRFIDSEPFGNSLQICDGTSNVLESYIHDGGFRFGCGNGSYVNFQLKNVARGTPADGGT